MIERGKTRRRIRKRRHGDERVDVGGHDFRSPLRAAPFEDRGARQNTFDQRAAVLENARFHAIAGNGHFALSTRPLECRDARLLLAVERYPSGVLADAEHQSREEFAHAANG